MRFRTTLWIFASFVLGCQNPEFKTETEVTADGDDADETPTENVSQAITVCSNNSPLKNVYFGDLHTHTSYSLDAYTVGTRVDPAGAYAFAAGIGSVTIASGAANGQSVGPTVTMARPLDFLAVTDHSEFFNTDYGCLQNPSSPYYNSTYCVNLRNQGSTAQLAEAAAQGAQLLLPNPGVPIVCQGGSAGGGTAAECAAQEGAAWQKELDAAAAANNPCTFTSLVAYEWTATTGGNNLHRNVIFKSDSVPSAPLDYIKYPTAHELWAGLSAACTEANGCDAITIPHNSNASGGQMFVVNEADVDYMVKYQTLTEIHQHKGSSECISDPTDSGYANGCEFELLPNSAAAEDAPGYIRPALEAGLSYYASHTGSAKKNPLRLGILAATDTHNSTPGYVEENTFSGHLGAADDTALLRVSETTNNCDPGDPLCTDNTNRDFNPGGITGVWAPQNTREEIFAALQRREVFGTSGPRIKVRFYQYWGSQNPCADASFPQQVVSSGGVPMGGTIASGVGNPKFVVSALKDVNNLAEVGIFKASVVNGQIVEKLVHIPVSGGSACVTWTDTLYSPLRPALYYARVLEQPSQRWSHYDCASLKQTNPTDWQTIAPGCVAGGGLDVTIQERAWTSPIWRLP